jgi:lipoprotein-releasing system permease protein
LLLQQKRTKIPVNPKKIDCNKFQPFQPYSTTFNPQPLYLTFAWRYFRAKKSANAINIIAWLSVTIIAIVTCAQIIVLSVFNGFEGLVKSLYSSFYNDIRVSATEGKTFFLTPAQINELKKQPFVVGVSMLAEENALLKNEESQKVVSLKGVDENYQQISGVATKISDGKFEIGTVDTAKIVVGSGVQNAAFINVSDALPASNVTIILPRKTINTNAEEAISEGIVTAAGVFSIQQDIDEKFAITNIGFVKQQMGLADNEYSAAEMKLQLNTDIDVAKNTIQKLLGATIKVQSRYEQNANLYNTMRMEKWVVYAVLTLIIIIASFTIISVLTMLVLEKQKDISILRSMGTTKMGIQKIFLAEGLLLGVVGAFCGIALAFIICLLQMKFHLIKIIGGTFLIDYFPVKMIATDFLLVACTALGIAFFASWFPARKAASKAIALK